MIELKFKNADKLKKKGSRLLNLKANKNKNIAKFTTAFDKLLKDETVQAMLALSGDRIDFHNEGLGKIKLKKNYGIKGGRYFSAHVESPTASIQDKDFSSNPLFKTDTNRSHAPSTLSVKPKEIGFSKAQKFVEDIMRFTFDIEVVYDSFVSQLIEIGERLAQEETEIDEDEEEFFANNTDEDEDEEDIFAVSDDLSIDDDDIDDIEELED